MMQLRPDQYLDGKGKVRRRVGKVPPCECCSKPAKVLLEIGIYKDDWLIKNCDICLDYVCDGCCDTTDDGVVTCLNCLQQATLNNKG